MKLGFEKKRELAIMVILVLLALFFVSRFLSSESPVATASRPTPAKPQARPDQNASRKVRNVLQALKPSLDPSLRFDLLRSSEEKEYEGGQRNIFREYVEVAKVEKPVAPAPTAPPVDTGPPPPPPIPLKYYGFASKPGEARKVFLSNGDEVFDAEEGQIIQRRYKIVKISASQVEVEDVLNNHKQIIPLTQG